MTRHKAIAPPGDQDRWMSWRAERLRAAGFPAPLAREVACERGIDLHAVLELVDGGCPPDLAARIMAPLDRDPKLPWCG